MERRGGSAVLAVLTVTLAARADAQAVAPASPPPSGTPTARAVAGLAINGFFIGSYGYLSALQIVPDDWGGAAAPVDPGRSGARFDKFGLAARRLFGHWLSISAGIEVESHRDRHSHLVTPTAPNRFGCPSGESCERFGAEENSIEVNLDRFAVTAIAPVGNGLSLAFGRFDTPFGIERHDEVLNLTATTSEVFRYGRPQRMTGFQAGYVFSPRFDVSAWLVNRWEAEETGEGDFNDNNGAKSVGGRFGFSPLAGETLLNIGLGGWSGAERAEGDDRRNLVTLDLTWSPSPGAVVAAELVRGSERMPTLREVGSPIAGPAEADEPVTWWGYSVAGHYDFVPAFGMSLRLSLLDDADRARTGVSQYLRSFTIAPVLHLSALVSELRPLTATVPRTGHPYHWVDLRLEYRIGHSDREVFGDAPPNISLHDRGSQSGHQVQLQLAVNF
jgi:hypothetical protein